MKFHFVGAIMSYAKNAERGSSATAFNHFVVHTSNSNDVVACHDFEVTYCHEYQQTLPADTASQLNTQCHLDSYITEACSI